MIVNNRIANVSLVYHSDENENKLLRTMKTSFKILIEKFEALFRSEVQRFIEKD